MQEASNNGLIACCIAILTVGLILMFALACQMQFTSGIGGN